MLACVSIVFLFPLSSFHSAKAQYKVVHLSKPHNTAGSETGAVRVGDTILSYASMPPSSDGGAFGFNNSVMQLYQARITREGKIARPKPNRWDLNSKKDHTGNLAVDPISHDLYFTRGDIETLRCDIWFAKKKQKRGWEKPVRLQGAVNNKQYTATHPTVGRLQDGTVMLYFVSDREGGYGGMDIWYSIVRNGVADEPVNLGPMVNSSADEYTPFYDQRNGILYFSSDRAGGKGGFDIYSAVGQRNTWQKAEPVCGCLNSEQNDLYFIITDYEPSSDFPIGGYLASNRADSYFLNDSMCCNDLYQWSVDSSQWIVEEQPPMDTLPTTNSPLPTIHYPLFLYFHNDEPDPRSRDSVTETSYADCQLRYALMRNEYLQRQTNAEDSAQMQLFFDSCVVGNFEHVLQLFDYIEAQLDEGRRVVLTVSGYASPLFTDDYNHLLSARRIGSFINMIRTRKGLHGALEDGRLRIVQQPRGIDNRSTSSGDAVYSIDAARARRIEIISCEIF